MIRVARSTVVALLVLLTTVALALVATVSTAVQLLATTALIMSGTFTPDPPPWFVKMAENQFIVPTHPTVDFDNQFEAVDTPEQAWPVTGLFDYPFGVSVRIGLSDLEKAMAAHGNDDLVIFGHSQSSVISYLEKRKLAAQFAGDPNPPNINFVTIGTLNLPNGGVMTRLWGLYLPSVDFYFNGPAPTDTPFHTDIVTQRWDGFADFPIYPIDAPAVLNAVLGFFYVHEEYADVTLAPDPALHFDGSHGDTDYYFFNTENLPLFGPLRSLGVPEALIDVVEPLTTFIVELGYRRDIEPWVPSPVRLIPMHDPAKVISDFLAAVNRKVVNTMALLGAPPPAAIPGAVAAPQMAPEPSAKREQPLPAGAPADVNAFRFAPPEDAEPVAKPAGGSSPTPQQAPVGEVGTDEVVADDVEESVVKDDAVMGDDAKDDDKRDDAERDEVTDAESAKTRDREPSPSDSSDSSAGSASGSGIGGGPDGGDSDS
ncbi:PE-PPE domain-containing protein [Mycobacterium sp. URHB0021]